MTRKNTHLTVESSMTITDVMIPDWYHKLCPDLQKKWKSGTLTGSTRLLIRVRRDAVMHTITKLFFEGVMEYDMLDTRYVSGYYDLRALDILASHTDVVSIGEELIYTVT